MKEDSKIDFFNAMYAEAMTFTTIYKILARKLEHKQTNGA